MGRSLEVWQQRVSSVRPEHYAGLRALLDSCAIEAEAAEALRRCQAILPAGEPKVCLMVGFFSPDGFVVQVEREWQIGLGLERLGEAARVPLLAAHEYCHWYRYTLGLPQPKNLGERLIEEGLAVHLSSLAYPERPLAQHLFVSESRLAALREYHASLLEAALCQLDETDEAAIRRFLFSPPTRPNLPPRPGGYVGYQLVSDYLRTRLEEAKTALTMPAAALLNP